MTISCLRLVCLVLTGLTVLEVVLGSCYSKTCKNGGTCTVNYRGYSYCKCPSGTNGNNCQRAYYLQIFTTLSGTITSPRFSSRSLHDGSLLNYNYKIGVNRGRGIKLSWIKFDVNGTMPLCSGDYVEIYIGCRRSEKSIGKYCSGNSYADKPFDVYSPDNCLRIVFNTITFTGKGFRAYYSSISLTEDASDLPDTCSSLNTLTANSGIISSPRWPTKYPTPIDCYWKIEVGSKKRIVLAVMDIKLAYLGMRHVNDRISLRGGDNNESYEQSHDMFTWFGTLSPGYIFSHTYERVWIRFKAEVVNSNHRGFVAGYVLYSACYSNPCKNGGTCTVTGNSGYRCQCPTSVDGYNCRTVSYSQKLTNLSGIITSPNVSYGTELNYEYRIRVNASRRIKLSWITFNVSGTMPFCSGDYVEINIGCWRGGRSIGKYCSGNSYADKPFDVYSPDNCLGIKFISKWFAGEGFRAYYSTISLTEDTSDFPDTCSSLKTLTANSGVISSPRWPIEYSTPTDCYWKIDVKGKKRIQLAFMDINLADKHSGSEDDRIVLRGGDGNKSYEESDPIVTLYQGSRPRFYRPLNLERVWIRFKTDGNSTNHRGFVAGYVLYSVIDRCMNNKTCKNGGTCLSVEYKYSSSFGYTCTCTNGFYGHNCQHARRLSGGGKSNTNLVLGVVGGIAGLVVIIYIEIKCSRRRKQTRPQTRQQAAPRVHRPRQTPQPKAYVLPRQTQQPVVRSSVHYSVTTVQATLRTREDN